MVKHVTLAGLNEQQAIFVRNIVDYGKNYKAAAIAAGYEGSWAYRLSSLPAVRQAIQDRLLWVMQTSDAPAARQVLRDIMDDPSASKPVRVECAKALLNRAGFVEPKAAPLAPNSLKAPSEMTGDELRGAMELLQKEIGERANAAKVIDADNAPQDDGLPSQIVDILG